jgi:hypothetical protein
MTAKGFAELLHARRTGRGKWLAQCPAHKDRRPSLSIGEGREAKVLVHCFAGCTHKEILAKVGLRERDLFAGPPPTPAQLASLQEARRAREEAASKERRKIHVVSDRIRKWHTVKDRLGQKLVQTPDDQAFGLAGAFHLACERLNEAETEADQQEARAKGKRAEGNE